MKGISSKEVSRVENALQEIISDLETFKNLAESYKAERSEKWCESEAGEAYEDKIERIDCPIDDVTNVIDEFTEIFSGD